MITILNNNCFIFYLEINKLELNFRLLRKICIYELFKVEFREGKVDSNLSHILNVKCAKFHHDRNNTEASTNKQTIKCMYKKV